MVASADKPSKGLPTAPLITAARLISRNQAGRAR